jgi:hypothetical protein
MSGIASGTSFGKTIIFLFWILFTYLIAYISTRVKLKIKLDFKLLIFAFLVSVVLLFFINIVTFKSILVNTGYTLSSQERILITFEPEAVISYDISRLDHTHSLKPALYKVLDPFVDVNSFKIDIGQALYPFVPSWLFYPILASFAFYLITSSLLIFYTARAWKGLFALFILLVFCIASCQFFIGALDGGLFSATTVSGIAILSIYLFLHHLRKASKARWVLVLIFLPLIILTVFNQLVFFITHNYVVTFEPHLIVSSLSIAAACFYAYRCQRNLMLVLIFILVFNLLTFKPYPYILTSREGDDVYMYLDDVFDPSVTDEDVLKRLDIPEFSNPEILARYERVVYARAKATRAGISAFDLNRKFDNERQTPLQPIHRIYFGDPELYITYTFFIPVNEDDLNKVSIDPIKINSFRKTGDLIEISCTAPDGLSYRSGCKYVMTVFNQNGIKLNSCLTTYRKIIPENILVRTGRSLSMLVPITSIRIKTIRF